MKVFDSLTNRATSDTLKLTADTATGVTLGVTNVPESPEAGSLILTVITIAARVVIEWYIERRKRKKSEGK